MNVSRRSVARMLMATAGLAGASAAAGQLVEDLQPRARRQVAPLPYVVLVDGGETHLTFVNGRTVIVSDGAPNRRGYVSNGPDHDEHWFAGATSPSYLAEKFLVKTWDLARAMEDLRDLGTEEALMLADAFEEMGGSPLVGNIDSSWYIGQIIDIVDCSDGVPGDGYDERELAWLVDVQARYRRAVIVEQSSDPPPHPVAMIVSFDAPPTNAEIDAFVRRYRECVDRDRTSRFEVVKPS